MGSVASASTTLLSSDCTPTTSAADGTLTTSAADRRTAGRAPAATYTWSAAAQAHLAFYNTLTR